MVSAIKALFLHRQGCLAPPADAVVRVSLLKGRSLYAHVPLSLVYEAEIDINVPCMLM